MYIFNKTCKKDHNPVNHEFNSCQKINGEQKSRSFSHISKSPFLTRIKFISRHNRIIM